MQPVPDRFVVSRTPCALLVGGGSNNRTVGLFRRSRSRGLRPLQLHLRLRTEERSIAVEDEDIGKAPTEKLA